MNKLIKVLLDVLIIVLLAGIAFFCGYLYALRQAVIFPLLRAILQKPAGPAATSQEVPPVKPEVPADHTDQVLKTYNIELANGARPDLPYIFLPPGRSAKKRNVKGKPVTVEKRKLNGIAFYQATVDLTEADVFPAILLANGAQIANSADFSAGDESFASFVKRARAALAINGTFFSKDNQKRVMGNMVSAGKSLKYSQWENYGTTLGIDSNNEAHMTTARLEGQPDWSKHWFSLTCGPRLVRDGQVFSDARAEGFTDDHVFTVGPRQAIGIAKGGDKLYIVAFLSALSLQNAGKMMQAIGCTDAMNLDGGASRGFAIGQDIKLTPGRPLTNVIVVYDSAHPAPAAIKKSWSNFEKH
ncbi:MAG: phosphodiester glycosidase family protein [Candidatus Obscuribacter sp.]|nr:phosphodiester glycosidase family protein [Candidatus Obscuribacter sp.]MBK9622077.1 phosphodiester glycosidase family protein [Candidatus Obscuribacter sp.]MBL0189055.1 phosphodiester glycosidase family protein [Candidatus Obscuribacter sp.]MBP7578323.1 phosphodiester glycosidase family protein [Candidatus Obscuribacter sp.]